MPCVVPETSDDVRMGLRRLSSLHPSGGLREKGSSLTSAVKEGTNETLRGPVTPSARTVPGRYFQELYRTTGSGDGCRRGRTGVSTHDKERILDRGTNRREPERTPNQSDKEGVGGTRGGRTGPGKPEQINRQRVDRKGIEQGVRFDHPRRVP